MPERWVRCAYPLYRSCLRWEDKAVFTQHSNRQTDSDDDKAAVAS